MKSVEMNKSKKIILLCVHFFITVVTILLTLKGVLWGASEGQLGENMINLGYFKAFTIDSNDFAAVTSAIVFVYLLVSLIKKEFEIPYWVWLIQFISSMALGLTFVCTATFLAPVQVSIGNSYWLYFSDDMFFLHFLTPVMVTFAFVWGNHKFVFGIKENLLGLLPLFLYSIVYVTNVVFLETWSDFYGFTFGGKNWVIVPVLIVIYAATFGIGKLIVFINNKGLVQKA